MPQRNPQNMLWILILVLLGAFATFADGPAEAGPGGDLKVEVKTPDPILTPGPLCLQIGVDNIGCPVCSVFTDVVVTTPLPDVVSFVSSTGCDEDPNGNSTCTVGTVSISEDYELEVVVNTSQSLNLCSTLVASMPTDLNPVNNTDCLTIFGTDVIFRDGFESGDLTAWSSSLP